MSSRAIGHNVCFPCPRQLSYAPLVVVVLTVSTGFGFWTSSFTWLARHLSRRSVVVWCPRCVQQLWTAGRLLSSLGQRIIDINSIKRKMDTQYAPENLHIIVIKLLRLTLWASSAVAVNSVEPPWGPGIPSLLFAYETTDVSEAAQTDDKLWADWRNGLNSVPSS